MKRPAGPSVRPPDGLLLIGPRGSYGTDTAHCSRCHRAVLVHGRPDREDRALCVGCVDRFAPHAHQQTPSHLRSIAGLAVDDRPSSVRWWHEVVPTP